MATLSSSLQGLTTAIQKTMISVHSLNVAALNTDAMSSSMSHEFFSLRKALDKHWADIKGLLLKCNYLVDSLIILGQSIGKESNEECTTFLRELMQSAAEIERECRTCILQNKEISENFLAATTNFPSPPPEGFRPTTEQLTFPTIAGLSDEAAAFMKSSLAAAHPDGVKCAEAVASSLGTTRKHLKALARHCAALRSEFNHPIGMKREILEDKCNRYMFSWKADREGIRVAVSAVSRSIDAINVAAHAASPRRTSSYPMLYTSPPPMIREGRHASRSQTYPPGPPVWPPFGMAFQPNNMVHSTLTHALVSPHQPGRAWTDSPPRSVTVVYPTIDGPEARRYYDEPAVYYADIPLRRSPPAQALPSKLMKGKRASESADLPPSPPRSQRRDKEVGLSRLLQAIPKWNRGSTSFKNEPEANHRGY